MLIKFWEGLGENLSNKWASALLTPAFVFWIGGFIAWVYRSGWTVPESWFSHLPVSAQVFLLIAGLLLVVSSSLVVQALRRPLLRLLAGYWPRWRWLADVRQWCVRRHGDRIDRDEQRWQTLANKGVQNLSAEEREEFVALDYRLRLGPADPAKRMPTKLGNLLRAAESRPSAKYGLDAVVCWPRLWLLLPGDDRKELEEACSNVNQAVCNILWGALFLVWTPLAWWAFPAGVLAIVFAYWRLLNAAEVYGDLLEAAFDLHRMALYHVLHWPLPQQTADEKECGERLTEYLFRGTVPASLAFKYAHEKK